MPFSAPYRIGTTAASATAVLLLAACASTSADRVPGEELPFAGSWAFSGAVEGEHIMRNGRQRFTEPVNGVIEFHPDEILVNGTHGSCTVGRGNVSHGPGSLRVRCGTMSLVLNRVRGEVTIPVQQLVEARTSCAQYRNPDGSGGCVSWNYRMHTRTVRLTGSVSVLESGSP